MERRGGSTLELRAASRGPLLRMSIPYNSESDDLGGFREVVRPGAFAAALGNGENVVALWNHDSNWPLGRTTNHTLALRDSPQGLIGEVELDPLSAMHQEFARRIER